MREIKGLKCRLLFDGQMLVCQGKVQPASCDKYTYQITYEQGQAPRFHIISPKIAPHSDIHRYRDESLCFFYPKDYIWMDNHSISKTFFPWLLEWILCYEYWKITGNWMVNEVRHDISTHTK